MNKPINATKTYPDTILKLEENFYLGVKLLMVWASFNFIQQVYFISQPRIEWRSSSWVMIDNKWSYVLP